MLFDRPVAIRIARVLFFAGAAWALPSAVLAWLLAGAETPPNVPLCALIGTLMVLCGLILGRAQAAMLLRWSATLTGITTLAIGLAHNLIAIARPLPNLLHRSFRTAESISALPVLVLTGINLAFLGLLLCLLSSKLERGDKTARLVATVLALYYLMAGVLAGVLVAPIAQTWALVWLTLGAWLLTALACSSRPQRDHQKSWQP